MTAAEIYKNTSATNQELVQVLKQLGFKDLSTEERFRFVHKTADSEVIFPQGKMDAFVPKVYLPAFAYRLFMQGIIENEGVLKMMIEKNRERQPALAA
ncbi:MAG: hypothetical protein ACK4Q5_04470 [Saprospiraceae bacterium]